MVSKRAILTWKIGNAMMTLLCLMMMMIMHTWFRLRLISE